MTHPLDVPFPGKETPLEVKGMADAWIITGPIQLAQHLANVWHLIEPEAIVKVPGVAAKSSHHTLNGKVVFGPMDTGHPWSQWAAESFANYSWMYFYARDLCDEYRVRWPHAGPGAHTSTPHGIVHMLSVLENAPEGLSDLPWSEPIGTQ